MLIHFFHTVNQLKHIQMCLWDNLWGRQELTIQTHQGRTRSGCLNIKKTWRIQRLVSMVCSWRFIETFFVQQDSVRRQLCPQLIRVRYKRLPEKRFSLKGSEWVSEQRKCPRHLLSDGWAGRRRLLWDHTLWFWQHFNFPPRVSLF